MTADTFPYSYKINAVSVVDKDGQVTVAPDADGRKAIADAFNLVGVDDLVADFLLKPYRKAGLRVVGPVTADIRQTCVVTLEPFESRLEIAVDRTFEPHSSRPRKVRDLNDDGEIEIDLETLDPPDVILDGVLDLGAVICEELALALDPFPRKPGVAFEESAGFSGGTQGEAAETPDDKPSPFAALQALKEKPVKGK